jgi:hypothetical protein
MFTLSSENIGTERARAARKSENDSKLVSDCKFSGMQIAYLIP